MNSQASQLSTLAESGFLAPDAWNCRKLQVSLKVAIDVPMLGTIIETIFSSGLAVNALWHGPDNDISSEKAVSSSLG